MYGKQYGASNNLTGLYITSTGEKNGFSDMFLSARFHSEFSSILMRNYKFSEVEWVKLNPGNFAYSGNGVEVLGQDNLLGYTNELLDKGFLVAYSKSSLENDVNIIASWLFTQPQQLKNFCMVHEKIKLKTELAVKFYKSIGVDIAWSL